MIILFGFLSILIGLLILAFFLRGPRLIFAVLLLLLPFHTGVFQVMRVELNLSPTISLILQSWKEVLLFSLLGWVILKILSTQKIIGKHLWMVLLVGMFILIGIISVRLSPSLLEGLYGFRGTFEPYIVLILALMLPLDFNWCKRVIPLLFIVASMVSAFAIFQVLFLGFQYAWKYYSQGGVLPSSFGFMGGSIQRAIGTFSSPNQLSLYLVFLIILILNLVLRQPESVPGRIVLIGLYITALVFTVSRSGWLALVAGLGFSFMIWRRKLRVVLIASFLAILALVMLYVLDLDNFIMNTLAGREISANYHMSILIDNFKIVLANPFGVGLGRVGARTFRFANPSGDGVYFATESYLMQTAMELGIPGLLLFLSIVASSGMVIYHNIFRLSDDWSRAVTVSALASLIAAFVHSLLIPGLQDVVVSSYLWFFVGLGMRMPAFEIIAMTQKSTYLD